MKECPHTFTFLPDVKKSSFDLMNRIIDCEHCGSKFLFTFGKSLNDAFSKYPYINLYQIQLIPLSLVPKAQLEIYEAQEKNLIQNYNDKGN